jgi:hypothetical protein
MKRVEVRAELAQLREKVTSQHPAREAKQYELMLLNNEIEKMASIEKAQLPKLSHLYGQLTLRKIELQVSEHALQSQVTSGSPDLRNVRAQLESLRQELDLLDR